MIRLALLSVAFLFASCEGPVGPEGPKGPEGPEGGVNYKVVHITVDKRDFVRTLRDDGWYLFRAVYRVSQITAKIWDDGFVLAYTDYANPLYWEPMEHFAILTTQVGGIRIRDYDKDADHAQNWHGKRIKLVIVSPPAMFALENVDMSDFHAVVDALGEQK